MILRPYQEQAVHGAKKWLNKYKKPGIIVAPTGSGKSLVVAALAKELGHTLVFQPNKELLMQNFEKYSLIADNATIFSASAKSKELGYVTFATIGSVVNRPKEEFDIFKYLIVDECHLYPSDGVQFYKFIKDHPDIKVIGLTATPFRLKTTSFGTSLSMLHGHSHIWGGYAHMTQIKEVSNYWSPIEYTQEDTNLELLKVNSVGSEYTDDSLEEYAESIEEKVFRLIDSYEGKKLLVFVPSVEQAARMSGQLKNASYVCSDTKDKERKDRVDRFKDGDIDVMFNVNIFSVGFDFPLLDGVIDGQPTLSLARYYQRVGRICRAHPDKPLAKYIDVAGNYKKFGKVEDLEFRPNKVGYHVYSGNTKLTGVPMWEGKAISEATMPFGKFKGKPLSVVPKTYLEWLWGTGSLFGDLKESVKITLGV